MKAQERDPGGLSHRTAPRRPDRAGRGSTIALLTLQRLAGNQACTGHVMSIQRQISPAQTSTPGADRLRAAIAENPAKSEDIADALDAARRGAAQEASSVVEIIVPPLAPTTVASSELKDLVDEARASARAYAAGSVASTATSRGLTVGDVKESKRRLAQIQAMIDDPASPLLPDDRAQLRVRIAETRGQIRHYEDLATEGSTRASALGGMGVFAGGVVADDATGIGVADDILLPFIGLAMLATIAATRPTPSRPDLARAWAAATTSLEEVAASGIGIVLAVQGDRLAGNTRQLAVHLARILALGSVGGAPSGEPPKPNDNNDKHWWSEIKAFLKSIGQATKGASRRQVMRELLRQGFDEQQVLEIERRLVEAAIKMAEEVPPFLPPP